MAKRWLRIIGFTLALVMLLSSFTVTVGAKEAKSDSSVTQKASNGSTLDEFYYSDYILTQKNTANGKKAITLNSNGAKLSGAKFKAEYEGRKNVIEVGASEASISWDVTVPNSALYTLKVKYIPVVYKGKDISFGLKLNGKTPYEEAASLILPIRWKDNIEAGKDFATDMIGNDLIPEQVQAPEWSVINIYDNRGFYIEPLKFALKAGKNTITIETNGEPVVIESVTLCAPSEGNLPTYKEYYAANSKKAQNTPDDFEDIIQAERPSSKSDPVLYPVYDRSDPELQPSDPAVIKRNIIGTGWSDYGQYIEWSLNVPEDGFYRLAFKYRQNEIQESASLRKFLIDGKVPFKEANDIGFDYSRGYSVFVPSDGEDDYLFYLTKGNHSLRLEVTLGGFSEIVRTLSEVQDKYSDIYRRIIMVTSTSPDMYRDYDIEAEIPTLFDELVDMSKTLKSIKELLENDGAYTADTKTLDEIIIQLESFIEKPYTIPERLSRFSSNNTTLATYISDLQRQPLQLDYIVVSSTKTELPKAEAGFFAKMAYEFKAFLSTFSAAYSGEIEVAEGEKSIEVWLNSGMEQMNVLNGLIGTSFTEQYGIKVNLKLVHCTLVQSVLADMEPDVMVGIARNDPVDLAMRGAVASLDELPGFEEMKSDYSKEAFVPYMLEGKTYAIPETQSFNMMFYRTDIFKQLGIEVPKTWEDFYNVSKKIIHKNMEVGLPNSTDTYATLVLQNGGHLFNENRTAMALDTSVAFDSFKTWTDFYTQLSFSMFKDDYNRFRTGEMPLAIMNYTFYNTLMVAAPEIVGKWTMTTIPGTVGSDGKIDYTTTATGTAAMILEASEKKEDSWTFLKWWSSAKVQADYGNTLEYILGPSARYTPANMKAFEQIPWSNTESAAILNQWKWVEEIPNVPGSYYVSRNIDNAFRAVTTRGQNYRESLNYWTKETNKEITRKRKQYGLD